jgi:hypothetical protein
MIEGLNPELFAGDTHSSLLCQSDNLTFLSPGGSSSLWSEIISKYLNGTAEHQLEEHRDLLDFGNPVSCRENEDSEICSGSCRRRRHHHHRHKHRLGQGGVREYTPGSNVIKHFYFYVIFELQR